MRNPYAPFDEEIARTIIGPRILDTFQANPNVRSQDGLRKAFCERYGTRVSPPKFAEWMTLAGIEVSKRLNVRQPQHEAINEIIKKQLEAVHVGD